MNGPMPIMFDGRFTPARANAVSYRGATYYTVELDGQRAVFWADDRAAFGLISTFDSRTAN